MKRFRNRVEAGRALARLLDRYRDEPDAIVLALPRGGVPVAFEVARALHAPLDVFVVRKLGVPGHEEYAMGAIASGGVQVMNPDAERLHIDPQIVVAVAAREARELSRREQLYRGDRPAPSMQGMTVILVDDGLATGSTMRAAAMAIRGMQPRKIVVAVPVGAAETCRVLRQDADEVVCAHTPTPFRGVGMWYDDFAQTSDDEVRTLLAAARVAA